MCLVCCGGRQRRPRWSVHRRRLSARRAGGLRKGPFGLPERGRLGYVLRSQAAHGARRAAMGCGRARQVDTAQCDPRPARPWKGQGGRRPLSLRRLRAAQRSAPMDARAPASPPPPAAPFEYRYTTEFQSHEPEFDYLKSLEIEEKINQARAPCRMGYRVGQGRVVREGAQASALFARRGGLRVARRGRSACPAALAPLCARCPRSQLAARYTASLAPAFLATRSPPSARLPARRLAWNLTLKQISDWTIFARTRLKPTKEIVVPASVRRCGG